jgi:hypothetical protein
MTSLADQEIDNGREQAIYPQNGGPVLKISVLPRNPKI